MTRFTFVCGLAFVVAGTTATMLAMGQEKAKTPTTKAQTPAKPQPIHVLDCTIKLIDEAILGSGRTGILSQVPKEGETVEKGKPVVRIKDDVAKATYETAKKEASNDVEVRYGEKNRDFEKTAHETLVDSNKRLPNTVPDLEVKKQRLAFERAELQIQKAEHDFAVAQLKKEEAFSTWEMFKIDAPFDGIVTRVYRNHGEAVREGDPVVEISSTSRVRVEGVVNIKDIWNINKGDLVKVQLDIKDVDLPEEKLTFDGKISFVDVKSQAVTQETRVHAEVDNPKNVLRAGLSAKMIIYPSQAPTQTAAQR